MLYLTVAFFLALVPLAVHFGIGDGIRTPKEIASIAGFICIILIGLNYTKRPFKNRFLLFFWGWCFFVTTVNTFTIPMFFPKNIILNMPAPFFAWKELYYITLVIFTIYTLSTVKSLSVYREYKLNTSVLSLRNSSYEEEIKDFANVINWLLIIMCVYAIIQALGLDNFFRATSGQVHADGSTPVAFTNTDVRFPFTHRVVGTIGNPGLLGKWIAVCLPFTLYLKKRRGYVGFLLGIIVLILTNSAAAIVTGIVAFSFYFIFTFKILKGLLKFSFFVIILSIPLIFIRLNYNDTEIYRKIVDKTPYKTIYHKYLPYREGHHEELCGVLNKYFIDLKGIKKTAKEKITKIRKIDLKKYISDEQTFFNPTGRIEIHKETWKILQHRPLLGWGLGTFEYMIGLNPKIQKRMDDDVWKELHDEYGQIWFSVGLVGLTLFLGFVFTAFVGFLRNQTRETIVLASSLLVFLIISLTSFPMRIAPVSFYGAVFTGLLIRGYVK